MSTQDTVNEFLQLMKNFRESHGFGIDMSELVELYKCHCLNQLNGTLLQLSKQLREKETRK